MQKIKVRIDGKIVETTTGRIIFNKIVPKEMGFFNQLLIKKNVWWFYWPGIYEDGKQGYSKVS